MATTEFVAPRTGRIDPKYTRSKSKGGSFEMAAWLFMRLSGVVLVVLIFGHLIANLLERAERSGRFPAKQA